MIKRCLILFCCFGWYGLAHAQTEWQLRIDSLQRTGEERQKMHQLFDVYMDWFYQNHPETATGAGISQYNDAWTDMRSEALQQRNKVVQLFAQAIASIDTNQFSPDDQLNYLLFKRQMEQAVQGAQYPDELMPVSNTTFIGLQHQLPEVMAMMPSRHEKDYQDALARLRGIPAYINQLIQLMDQGLQKGIMPPRIAVSDTPAQLTQLMEEAASATFLKPFQSFPETIPAATRDPWKKQAEEVFASQVKPALQQLHDYLTHTYIPKARETVGISALPEGNAWYQHNIRKYTTTDLTAEAIHQIGLKEVARIRREMDKIIKSTGFKGSFADFTEFLRTDTQFYYQTPEALLTGYRDICKRIDPELIRFFGKLPRLPYGVKAIPDYAARSATTAYYSRGSYRATRPGYFYANTYDLASRPIWEMEALTLHEAVPGHHLQIALSQELEGMPDFREASHFTAFVEGWALYAESLGEAIGLYQNPYAKFGQLTYEMWRAIRLVVDTGIHQMGWSRDQAIQYFVENSAKTEHDIAVEVDRYIAWPGQALAYKMGELKIQELRQYAEQQLGAQFDIRSFHDALLSDGALPLDILEKKMKQWVAAQR